MFTRMSLLKSSHFPFIFYYVLQLSYTGAFKGISTDSEICFISILGVLTDHLSLWLSSYSRHISIQLALCRHGLFMHLYAFVFTSGWINTLLSWKGVIPLSRLTYCAYLFHPAVLYYYYSSRRQLIYFNDIEIVSKTELYLFLNNATRAFQCGRIILLLKILWIISYFEIFLIFLSRKMLRYMIKSVAAIFFYSAPAESTNDK